MHASWIFFLFGVVAILLTLAAYSTALQYRSGDKRRRQWLWMGIALALLALVLCLLSYYTANYLCPGSPHVPVRCKSFPWEN